MQAPSSRLLLLLLLHASAATVMADPLLTEAEWLKTMSVAARQTNYSGVFVYQSGESIEISRITHVMDKDGEHERLEGLVGVHRELVRDNDQVWLFADGRKIRLEKRQISRAFPAMLPEQIAGLKDSYSIRQTGEDMVAGYHAHIIEFSPRDNLRYVRKMWADRESGLLLKAVVLDSRNNPIEQYAFMQLNIGSSIERKWSTPSASATASEAAADPTLSPLPKAEPMDEPCGWQVDALPTGFRKVLQMRRLMRVSKEPVIQMVYSDGLAGISVFIEKVQDASPEFHTGLSGQGAAHVYNRLVGDNLVTVVGEVPPRTVIQVGDSVRYAGQ